MNISIYFIHLFLEFSELEFYILSSQTSLYYYYIYIPMDSFISQDLAFPLAYLEQNKHQFGNYPQQENKFNFIENNSTKKQKRMPKSTNNTEKPRQKKILQAGIRVGHWTKQEKKRYHWFLEIYHSHFQNKQMRRMDKIFKTMADFLGSRAADQCRSHHQKMEKKFKTFYNIIYNLRLSHYDSANLDQCQNQMRLQNIQLIESLIQQSELLTQLHKEIQQQKQSNEKEMNHECYTIKYDDKDGFYLKNQMEIPLNLFHHQLSEDYLF